MSKATPEYVMPIPKSNDGLWIKNIEPVPAPNEIRFGFPDGTFATFKEAKSLQEFLDKMARHHELEKDLEIAKKAMNQVMIMGASNNTCSFLKAQTVKSILGKALEQITHDNSEKANSVEHKEQQNG